MAKASNSHDSVDSYDSDDSFDENEFVFHRSRGRTRREDSWLRRYRRKMRKNGKRSPESEERRSLTPYNCVNKKYIKPKKQKKKKKNKKTGVETPKSSTDSMAVDHANNVSEKDSCPSLVSALEKLSTY